MINSSRDFHFDDATTSLVISSMLAERDRLLHDLEELKDKKSRMKIQDSGMATLWDASDERYYDRELQLIREGRLKPQVYEDKLLRYLNDQTVYFEIDDTKHFEPLDSTEPKDDLVVNVGLAKICQFIAGKSTILFTDYASGTGTVMEKPSDIRLVAENSRVSLSTHGFIEAVGTSVKFAGKFATSLPTAVITEGGVFDSSVSNAGNMLFRTVYTGGSRVQHVQNRTFYSLFQTIVLISVT